MSHLTHAPLLRDLHDTLFRPSGLSGDGPPLVGVELEVFPVFADTGRRVPTLGAVGSFMALLRPLATRHGWRERMSAKGTPVFDMPGGSRLTFEPGGQVELSLAPHRSVSGLLRELERLYASLDRQSAEHGIQLLTVGMDPENAIEDVPLQFQCERYRRMTEYFDNIGPAGVRMMRQTATLHVNLDMDGGSPDRWRLLNAMAPVLLAMFANSPRYEGEATGYRSYRGETWRTLDWSRTGLADRGGDPVTDFLQFALDARVMLLDPVEGEYPLFRSLWEAGSATIEDWHKHLTTLFPEVRSRGYLEMRAMDAQTVSSAVAPITLLTGIVYDPTSMNQALDLLGPAQTALLHVAGEQGLGNDRLARMALELVDIGLAGCRRLGPSVVDGADLERATDFFDRYTRRRLCPADDHLSPAGAAVASGAGR
jgi:glutamate--cysteine ligase